MGLSSSITRFVRCCCGFLGSFSFVAFVPLFGLSSLQFHDSWRAAEHWLTHNGFFPQVRERAQRHATSLCCKLLRLPVCLPAALRTLTTALLLGAYADSAGRIAYGAYLPYILHTAHLVLLSSCGAVPFCHRHATFYLRFCVAFGSRLRYSVWRGLSYLLVCADRST
jgi:hypothetical protein